MSENLQDLMGNEIHLITLKFWKLLWVFFKSQGSDPLLYFAGVG